MKKSKAFYLAEISVLQNEELTYEEKIEIVKLLAHEEDMARYSEKREEQKNEAV